MIQKDYEYGINGEPKIFYIDYYPKNSIHTVRVSTFMRSVQEKRLSEYPQQGLVIASVGVL